MNAPLYKFQELAADRVRLGDQVYLGFDPGLGKSRTALEAAQRCRAKRVLVTCPASGRYVWEQQIKLWAPGVPFHIINGLADIGMLDRHGIVVLTYGLISQKDSPFVDHVAKGRRWNMAILDEAAALKNPAANRTKAVLGRMLPKFDYVLPMSGTPAPNHAGELYAILKALYPSAIQSNGKAMQQWQFEDQFCRVKTKPFGPDKRGVRVIEGSRNLPELRKRIDGFMIRVRKEDVLTELPPVQYVTVPVEPRGVPSLPPHLATLPDDELLAWFAKDGTSGPQVRRMLGVAKALSAAEYINDFLENAPAKTKVLVFAHHREVVKLLEGNLGNWGPVVVQGSTNPADRTTAVNQFLTNDNCRVFIANILAAGTGLTLVGPDCKCSDVFFVEASYNAMDNVQATARVHRIGQSDAVIARFLTAHGTVDDRVQEIITRKTRDFENLFG